MCQTLFEPKKFLIWASFLYVDTFHYKYNNLKKICKINHSEFHHLNITTINILVYFPTSLFPPAYNFI